MLKKGTGIFTVFASFLIFATPAIANMLADIPPELEFKYSSIFLTTLFIFWVMNAAVEALVAYALMRKKVRSKKEFIKTVVIVNLITFLPTQILFVVLLIFAEIFPVVVEYFLLKQWFLKLYEKQHLSELPSKNELITVVLITNGVTFFLGIAYYLAIFFLFFAVLPKLFSS